MILQPVNRQNRGQIIIFSNINKIHVLTPGIGIVKVQGREYILTSLIMFNKPGIKNLPYD